MKNTNWKQILKVAIPLMIALISIFGLSKIATSTETHAKTIESLDEKKTTVMELTAASTAASTAITLLPGDTATPLAEKLADLSSYFLVVLCAIYLEKYLLTITGYAAFTVLIPIACILWLVYTFKRNEALKRLAIKLAVFGAAIVLVVPTSMKVSDLIERTYTDSIEETIESAKQTTKKIEENVEGTEKEEGFLNGVFSTVKGGVSGVVEKVESILNNFVEALAVMIVTSCVIPIVVLMFFVWLVKMVTGVDINMPKRIRANK